MSFDMKYIDAARLREELQKPKTELKVGNYYLDNSEQAVGYENALIDFELLIDSLQQEQDCIVINKKDWEAQEQFKKNKDFGKSLKEEQPKKSKKDCNGCPHCVDRKDQYGWHFKGCFGGPYKGKFIAEIDECPLEQEHSEMDLEKEVSKWWDASFQEPDFKFRKHRAHIINNDEIIKLAHHFYELGLNARKA